MGMQKRPNYFLLTAPFVAIIAIIAVIKPNLLTNSIIKITTFLFSTFDWLIVWIPLLALGLGLYFAFSQYGNIRLGGPNAQVEYSLYSWMSMLFTAGIGVGIIFYGPIEALWYYLKAPIGVNNQFLTPPEAMENAMALAIWVWGIPAWALYTIGGLITAYFAYQHNMDFSPSAVIEKSFEKKKWSKTLSIIILAFAIISITLSVASSIAMATGQISSGLNIITEKSFNSMFYKIIILILLFIIYTGAAIFPIKKGMKILGDYTMYLALILLAFIFLVGPTHYFVSVIINTIGRIITQTIPFSLELYLFRDRSWFIWYPISYWVWWITWTPFIGVFLAKISKGRTIREVILASIFVPSGFMIVWFCVFSGFALLDTIEGTKTLAKIANSDAYEGVIYNLLNLLPASNITKIITVILLTGFVVTTVTSTAISLGIMTSKDGKTESKYKAIIWSIFMTLIGFAVIVTGKIEGIKSVGSFAGFPFVFLMLLQISGFIKQIKKDHKNKSK